MANVKRINETRDKVYEQTESLTEKSAQRLFEEPFIAVINDLSASTRKEIFLTAKEEVDVLMKGRTSWTAVFNTYAELAALVELSRVNHTPKDDDVLTDLALEVFSAQNRLSTLFYVLRTHKELTENQGRGVIEAAFPLAVRSLNENAKKAIFSYVYERNSGQGWGYVAEEYTKIIELVARVKEELFSASTDIHID